MSGDHSNLSIKSTGVFRRQERPAALLQSGRVLLVVVDTEEEFDWTRGFARSATDVAAMDEVGRFQEVCDCFGIRPAYVVDFPVASQERGFSPLRKFQYEGRAEIGAHLHPWVNPPFAEEVNARNSYPGNLPETLEKEKLRSLTEQIEKSFGVHPTLYKAGRYGFGPNTLRALSGLGYLVDASFCPSFDFSADGGPDYSATGAEPFWFGATHESILEVPNTGAFVGFLGALGRPVHRWAKRPSLERWHAPGILLRLGAVNRILLSPEGHSLDEMRRLTLWLLARGLRVFTLSLHSPSMKPGCTPYVQAEADRQEILGRCRDYFRFFLEDLGGISMTTGQLRGALSRTSVDISTS
jgi:hypothetical protein